MGICVSRILKKTDNTVPLYSLEGQVKTCKVVDVYDGDTITVNMILDTKIRRIKVRMEGYDSPEMRPPRSQVDRDEEIQAAKESKSILRLAVFNKIVTIRCGKFDKYGRLLGTIIVNTGNVFCSNSINVNSFMIKEGHGIPYDGGTKIKFSDWKQNN